MCQIMSGSSRAVDSSQTTRSFGAPSARAICAENSVSSKRASLKPIEKVVGGSPVTSFTSAEMAEESSPPER